MDKTCPKCDRQVDNYYWHRNDKSCRKDDVNKPTDEHMHYYCRCGYDFTKEVKDGA